MSHMNEDLDVNGSGASLLQGTALEDPAEKLREQLEILDERARSAVKERPLLAVGIAIAVGYLAGRVLARR